MLCPPHSHQTHPFAISNSPNRFFRERPSHRATHHTRFCARARWCACAYMCVQPNAASSLSHALRPNGPAARRASRTAQRASAHQRHYFARPCMCVSACRRVRERARVYAFVVNQKRVACCVRGVVAFLWLWLCVAEFQFTRLYFLLPVRLCCVEAWAFRLLYGASPERIKAFNITQKTSRPWWNGRPSLARSIESLLSRLARRFAAAAAISWRAQRQPFIASLICVEHRFLHDQPDDKMSEKVSGVTPFVRLSTN